MEQLTEFMGNNPMLFMALGVVVGLLVWTSMMGGGSASLSPTDVTRMLNDDNDAVVLDVRSDAEFETGHIVGAVHVVDTQVDGAMNRLQKYKERPVIATCRTGQRSAAVAGKLRKIGIRAGMDAELVDACMQDGDKAQAMVALFQKNAAADDVRGTPSFVIEGEKVSNMNYADFAAFLDEKLGE